MSAQRTAQRESFRWLVPFVFAVLLAGPAHADKKKAAPTAEQKIGDQRSKGYFDVSKIVWPNPPSIARIKFVDLFTGQKVDPNLLTKKNEKPKQKWMDRLAGSRQVDDMQMKDLPFQLIRTYGVAVDSKGQIYAADQGVSAIFIFNPENKAVDLIGNGKQVHFGSVSGLAMDDNDRLFVTDVGLHRVDVFTPAHQLETAFGGDILSAPSSVAIDYREPVAVCGRHAERCSRCIRCGQLQVAAQDRDAEQEAYVHRSGYVFSADFSRRGS